MKKTLNITIPESDLQLTACKFYKNYEHWFHKAFYWSDTTQNAYFNYMDKLDHYLKVPLIGADVDDYNNAILEMNSHRRKEYSQSTLNSIRSVINDICAFVEFYSKGKFSNTLWGTAWNALNTKNTSKFSRVQRVDEQINRKLRTPRSLSIPEEIKLLTEIHNNFLTDSFYLGIAILFYLGLRPGECCGLKFGDIRPLQDYPDVFCLYVYSQIRSTSEKTNQLKTANAYRVLPIPAELHSLIVQRREKVENELGQDCSAFPILCLNDSPEGYKHSCRPKDFLLLCKRTLRQCEVAESTMKELSVDIYNEDPFKEASATAYLLRRNFATALSGVCGMDEDEIKYMMGHAIYTLGERRSDFLNPDTLFSLYKKLNRRHYKKLAKDSNRFEATDRNAIIIHQKHAKISVTAEALQRFNGKVNFTVWNDYPNDSIDFKLLSDKQDGITIEPMHQYVPLKNADRVWLHREFTEAVNTSRNHSEGHKKRQK